MTRKHFKAIASAVHENLIKELPNERFVVQRFINEIARVCKEDNKNFDRMRFIFACEEGE